MTWRTWVALLLAATGCSEPLPGGRNPCDMDGDGSRAIGSCGGDDCDDTNVSIHPGAPDALDSDAWQLDVAAPPPEPSLANSLSLAVDASGLAHVCYEAIDGLGYATNGSGAWSDRLIAEGTPDTPIGDGCSIALDAMGYAYASYYDLENVSYATNVSGAWAIEPIAEHFESPRTFDTAIAVDPSGAIHVVHLIDDPPGLSYARRDPGAGAWSASEVTAGSTDTAGSHALAIDAAGHAHVAYVAIGAAMELRYATNSAGAWTSERIASVSASSVSIAIDPSGVPHVVYVPSGAAGELRHTRRTGPGAWTDEVVAMQAEPSSSSFVLDGAGVAHVSWLSTALGSFAKELRYATNGGGAWASVAVDRAGGTRSGSWLTSIGIDAAGGVHIAYTGAAGEDVGSINHALRARADGVDQDCDGADG